MSWEVMNQILGLAAIDAVFARALLKDPVGATQLRGFPLTKEERQVFSSISAHNLREFSQCIVQAFGENGSGQETASDGHRFAVSSQEGIERDGDWPESRRHYRQ